jgi:hypothetical protein
LLRHPDFMGLDPPMRDVPVDPTANAVNGWDIEMSSEQIAVRFGSALSYVNPLGNSRTIPLLPGIYMIAVEATVGHFQASRATRPMTESSNYLPVMAGAFIEAADQPDAGDPDPIARRRFVLTLAPAFNIARDNADPIERLDVRLVIDGVAYERVDDDDQMDENGQFFVTANAAGASGPHEITLYDDISVILRSHFDPDVPGEHAIRLIIDGSRM